MSKDSKITNIKDYKKKRKKVKAKSKEEIRKIKAIRARNAKKRRFLFLCCVFAIVMVTFMHRYSVISNLEYQYQTLNKDLKNKNNQKKQLEIDIDSLSKSGFIEQQAREKLNMEYPTEEQTIYIKVD